MSGSKEEKQNKKLKPEEILKILREAGNVSRCHTIPYSGSYTIAQHCYGAVSILLLLHPKPSVNLVKAVMWHDVHERYLGDVPAPALWSDGEFAKLYDRLAERINKTCGIHSNLNIIERMWLNAVDKMDLLFWAQEQLGMGNHNAAAICGNLASWFKNNKIPTQCVEMVSNYNFTRGADELPG